MKQALVMLTMAVGAWTAAAQGPATRLDLTSQPSQAAIFIDGRARGVTPASFFDVRPGRRHIKFRLAGHGDHDAFVTVEEGRPQKAHAVLEAEKGILLVKSDPPACEISIDGVAVGTTPRLVTTLDAKNTYRMTLRKAGYREATFEIKFNGRVPLVRTERLIRDSGVLKIVSTPPGAAVTVNGVARGCTPVTVSDVPKGRATVKLTLDGFSDETISDIRVSAGDQQTISREMKALPGTLSLTSVPEGARFYVNGEFRGKDPLVLANLRPGTYSVRAEREGYGTATRAITVANGASAREEFRLSNKMGRLEVRTNPPGAQILFDGRVIGTTAASDPDAAVSDILAVDNVLEGEHVLVVRRDGYAEQTRRPRIQSAQTTKADVRLRRVFKPDVRVVTENGVYDGVLVGNSADHVTVEVRLGIQRSFRRAEIRRLVFLKETPK